MSYLARLGAAICTITFATHSSAATLFTDSFDSGASPKWSNEVGAWSAVGGFYGATLVAPADFPSSNSALPFSLTDFTAEIDVIDIKDGGFWLHSSAAPGTRIGRTGVVLVTGGRGGIGTGLYWHIVSTGDSYGVILNERTRLFVVGTSDAHITITVQGDTYSAFVNGSSTPATQLKTNAFASGQFSLFDSGPGVEKFDKVVISTVPELPPAALLLAGIASLACRACSNRGLPRGSKIRHPPMPSISR